jgi:pyridoxamine 5'-phosphate oxidase
MINFNNPSKEAPYIVFQEKYKKALDADQKNIEAVSISSFNKKIDEVDSRFVNLKIINDEEFIFFSNYWSPKDSAFESHNQIAATFFWASINTQIRIKAKIKKTSKEFNQIYFSNRSKEKNALAISSNQSRKIESFNMVQENFKKSLMSDDLKKCPDYWGGYSFTPYYFEFWEGHESRVNKREVFDMVDGVWKQSFLQP